VNLDSSEAYAADASGALGDVLATAQQWEQARRLKCVRLDLDGIDSVVVTGMGGSGICGDVLWALGLDDFPLPVIVHKGYGLPGFVDRKTLVVSISYSGATEETVTGYSAAGERGAMRLVVASGGPLVESAGNDGVPAVVVPGGRQPRHSLGYLLVPALVALGLDDGLDEAIEVMQRLADQLGPDVPTDDNLVKRLARQLTDEPVVALALGGRGIGSLAAYRLKCQLNENAKLPALHGELPEADHNEVVAWQESSPLTGRTGLIAFRDPVGEHDRVGLRFTVTMDLLADRLAWRHNVVALGGSPLARTASLLLQADLISIYAAVALGRDPTPIPNIDRLKQTLSNAAPTSA
jgi:glucose/mannose-6-phosphate isomerase